MKKSKCISILLLSALLVVAILKFAKAGADPVAGIDGVPQAITTGDAGRIYEALRAVEMLGEVAESDRIRRNLTAWLLEADLDAISKRSLWREVVRLDLICVESPSWWIERDGVRSNSKQVWPHMAIAFARAADAGRLPDDDAWGDVLQPIWGAIDNGAMDMVGSAGFLAVMLRGRWGGEDVAESVLGGELSTIWAQVVIGVVRSRWLPRALLDEDENGDTAMDLLRVWCGRDLPLERRDRVRESLSDSGFLIDQLVALPNLGLADLEGIIKKSESGTADAMMILDEDAMSEWDRPAYVMIAILLECGREELRKARQDGRRIGTRVMSLRTSWDWLMLKHFLWYW